MKMNQLAQSLHASSALKAKPRDKMNALLECQNTKEAVSSLTPMEFYDLYHAVGANDAMELLNYCSGEQVQTCFDLDIWRNDHMEDAQLKPWVEQLLAIESDDQFKELFHSIDPEIIPLFLHRNVHLYMAENKDDEVKIPEGESPNVAQTPDMTYWIAYPEDADKAEVLRQLVDRIYIVLGVEKAWAYLEGMHFEMESELEEMGYRFRTERIREYGFMPREEACVVFAPCNIDTEAEAMRRVSDHDLFLHEYDHSARLESAIEKLDASQVNDTYFSHVLAGMDDVEPVRIQLLSLAQRVATADGFQPHEEQGLDDSMFLAIADINIGLEYVSRHDDDTAKRILKNIPLQRIFNLGHNVTMELHRKAKILTVRGHLSIIEDQPLSLLTTTQRDCIEGLLEPRPRPALSALTPFVSMRDVAQAAQVIADIALREVFFGEAAHKTKDDIAMFAYTRELYLGVENVNFDNVATTWLINRTFDHENAWRPIKLSELPSREACLNAVNAQAIRLLYKSNLDETTAHSQERLAHQLTSALLADWPEGVNLPDPRAINAIVFENEEDV